MTDAPPSLLINCRIDQDQVVHCFYGSGGHDVLASALAGFAGASLAIGVGAVLTAVSLWIHGRNRG